MRWGRRGMETWQLVMIILALVLLMAVIIFYGELGEKIEGLLGSLGDLF